MPGVYHNSDFDCAGFAVGVVDEDKRIGSHLVQAGDVLLGISSSGFHSNGYSLLRKVFAAEIEKGDSRWVQILLEPTALYVQVMKQLMQNIEIHAAAHITGGGIENIPRECCPRIYVGKCRAGRYQRFSKKCKRAQK